MVSLSHANYNQYYGSGNFIQIIVNGPLASSKLRKLTKWFISGQTSLSRQHTVSTNNSWKLNTLTGQVKESIQSAYKHHQY